MPGLQIPGRRGTTHRELGDKIIYYLNFSRYSLNFKGIPYKTEWVEYPDIEALYKKLGGKPTINQDGTAYYSLPLIHDISTGAVVPESAQIAQYLDATYPYTPKLFPQGTAPLQYAFIDIHGQTLSALPQFALPQTNTILNPESQEYFRRTREVTFGRMLEDVVPKGEEREVKWGKVREEFGRIDGWYQAGREDGMFVLGDRICFADFVHASFLLWMKKIWGEESMEWKDVKTWHGGRLVALVDALAKYETIL